jgi:ribosome biogenesis GTPase A
MFFNFLTSFTIMNKKVNQTSKIIQLKTFHKSLTQNRLVDLDLNETVKNIVAADESDGIRHEIMENDNINSFIKQNIENVDDYVKVMFIGISRVGKTAMINSFIGNTDEQDPVVYRPTTGIDIKKTNTRILDKNIRIEFMDTEMDIHYNVITKCI